MITKLNKKMLTADAVSIIEKLEKQNFKFHCYKTRGGNFLEVAKDNAFPYQYYLSLNFKDFNKYPNILLDNIYSIEKYGELSCGTIYNNKEKIINYYKNINVGE